MSNVIPSKAELRRQAKLARASMSVNDRDAASMQICETLARQSCFQRASSIAIYLATPDEVSCWPLIERAWRMKKRIFAPIVKKNAKLQFCELRPNSTLRRNRYNIQEPAEGERIISQRLDMVVTPLLAFDRNRNRLGMGGGYYDRTFSFLKTRNSFTKPKLVGIAFNCQRSEEIPASPWDIPLFQVVTELGTEY
jgi:5-formyltetrahydrofolate cyclo-ligase